MLDPWIIEIIQKREEEKRRRQEEEQPRVPADDPRENPESDDRGDTPKPGYEMPSGDDGEKPDTGQRGVDTFDIGGEMDINPGKKD